VAGKIEILLPWPPSVNMYWRGIVIGGRARTLLSEKGNKYRQRAASELLVQGLAGAGLDGRFLVDIVLCGPTKARRDVDNFTKGIFDALTYARVWLDDSQVDDVRVTRGPVTKGGAAFVVLTPIDENLLCHLQKRVESIMSSISTMIKVPRTSSLF
jgi:crossover junction endodeoxyribonuclease RusA